jgi:hypothetical protein
LDEVYRQALKLPLEQRIALVQRLLGSSGLQVSLEVPWTLRSIAQLFDTIAEKIETKNWQRQRDRLVEGMVRVLDTQGNLHTDLRGFLQRAVVLLEKAQNLKSVETVAWQVQCQLTLNPACSVEELSHDTELLNFYMSFRSFSMLEIVQLTTELLRSIDSRLSLNSYFASNQSE